MPISWADDYPKIKLADLSEAERRKLAAESAVLHLRIARDALAVAGATRTLARVKLALSSAAGAVRNAEQRKFEWLHRMRHRQ